MRDLRTVNISLGQKVESEKVLKRIGDISYRDLGVLSKIALFDSGKALITSGLRVVPKTNMTVTVGLGKILQRITSEDIMPCIAIADQDITMDSASGSARIDIVECQVQSLIDKNDTSSAVIDPITGIISIINIKRDIKYFLAIQKRTNNSTATPASAGILTGTVSIPGTIDLSVVYLLNIADGEDGGFLEIDLRGSSPSATTKAEIVSKINTAVGRTMASISGNYIVLTGNGTGITSFFEIKPPITNTSADALQAVFGVSNSGFYSWIYKGTNEWVKLCEIDIGTSTTVITTGMIRNIDNKSTWASDGLNVIIRELSYANQSPSPVGSIVAYLSGYFANSSNGTYTAVAQTLPVNWAVCDGSALNDPESPIFNGASRYLPNLTDERFIKGSTIALSGVIGGNANNQFTLTTTELPSHTHTYSGTTGNDSPDHTHSYTTVQGTATNDGGTYYTNHTPIGSTTGGASTRHTHTFSGTTVATGTGTAFSILPKFLTCAYIMRIK